MKFKKVKLPINVCFLIVVLVILIIPVLSINKDVISEEENRTLTKYKSIYNKENKTINTTYCKDFENWFKDRFFGRLFLIHINNNIKYFLSGRFVRYKEVIIDKNNEIMYGTLQVSAIPTADQNKIRNKLQSLNEYLKKQNIKLYVVVVPQKETIYPPILNRRPKSINNIKSVIVDKNYGVNMIFAANEYMDSKKILKYPLFFKTDSHETDDGVFVSYNTLMKEIQKDFHDIYISRSSDFYYIYNNLTMYSDKRVFRLGHTCITAAGLPKSICYNLHNAEYRYYVHRDIKNLKIKSYKSDKLEKEEYFYPKGNNLRCLLIGDSFMDNLMDVMSYSFKHCMKIHLRYFLDNQILKNEIDEFKPDIVVIYIRYGGSYTRLEDFTVPN